VQVLGTEHPAVAKMLRNYADLLRGIGREQEAAAFDAHVETIRARLFQGYGKRVRGTGAAGKRGKLETG
jgi:hypothetical protein